MIALLSVSGHKIKPRMWTILGRPVLLAAVILHHRNPGYSYALQKQNLWESVSRNFGFLQFQILSSRNPQCNVFQSHYDYPLNLFKESMGKQFDLLSMEPWTAVKKALGKCGDANSSCPGS